MSWTHALLHENHTLGHLLSLKLWRWNVAANGVLSLLSWPAQCTWKHVYVINVEIDTPKIDIPKNYTIIPRVNGGNLDVDKSPKNFKQYFWFDHQRDSQIEERQSNGMNSSLKHNKQVAKMPFEDKRTDSKSTACCTELQTYSYKSHNKATQSVHITLFRVLVAVPRKYPPMLMLWQQPTKTLKPMKLRMKLNYILVEC